MFFLYKSITDYKKQDTSIEPYFPSPRECRKIFMAERLNGPDELRKHPYIEVRGFHYVIYPGVDTYRLKVIKNL